MSESKTLKFGPVLLCEYATRGENRKYTLVNIFSGSDVIVGSLPGQMSLGFYAELIPEEDTPTQLTVEIQLNGKSMAKVEFQMENLTAGKTAVLLFQHPLVRISGAGALSFHASAKGYEPVEIMRKNISINPALARQPSTSEEQPVETSDPGDADGPPRVTRPKRRRVR